MEQALLQIGSAFGFAGFLSTIIMIWFLRSQASMARQEEAREKDDREFRRTLVAEIVASRRESNEVIKSNTHAWVNASSTLQEMCSMLQEHDKTLQEHKNEIGMVLKTQGSQR